MLLQNLRVLHTAHQTGSMRRSWVFIADMLFLFYIPAPGSRNLWSRFRWHGTGRPANPLQAVTLHVHSVCAGAHAGQCRGSASLLRVSIEF